MASVFSCRPYRRPVPEHATWSESGTYLFFQRPFCGQFWQGRIVFSSVLLIAQTRPSRRPAFLVPVALLIFSLALCVATRFVHYYSSYNAGTNASSYSPLSKRQDLEKDALQWSVPVQAVAFFVPPSYDRLVLVPVVAPRPPLSDQSLFDRPPPSF